MWLVSDCYVDCDWSLYMCMCYVIGQWLWHGLWLVTIHVSVWCDWFIDWPLVWTVIMSWTVIGHCRCVCLCDVIGQWLLCGLWLVSVHVYVLCDWSVIMSWTVIGHYTCVCVMWLVHRLTTCLVSDYDVDCDWSL